MDRIAENKGGGQAAGVGHLPTCSCKGCVLARAAERGWTAPFSPEQWYELVPPPQAPPPDPPAAEVAPYLAKLAGPLTKAEKQVDQALERFTAADAAWLNAVRWCRAVEDEFSTQQARHVVVGAGPATVAEAESALGAAKTTEEEARFARDAAAEKLSAARARLHDLQRHATQAAAGMPVRDPAGEARGILERIRRGRFGRGEPEPAAVPSGPPRVSPGRRGTGDE